MAEPTRELVYVLDMLLEEWTYASCVAHFGIGFDPHVGAWATLYDIRSQQEGQGHATTLLRAARAAYEAEGKAVWGSVALTERMARLYAKVGIAVYAEEEGWHGHM